MKRKNTQIMMAYGALGLLTVGLVSYDYVSRIEGPVPDLALPAQVRLHASAPERVTTEGDAATEGNQSREEATPQQSVTLAAH